MKQYHKIQSVYKRNPQNNHKTFLDGEWSIPEFGWLANNKWKWTEKIDGTNIRVMWDGEKVTFNGKTDNAQIPGDLVNYLIKKYNEDMFYNIFGTQLMNVCIYGEGYGAGIQKVGKLYRPDKAFVAFDIMIDDIWLEQHNVEDIAVKLETDFVPTLGEGTLYDAIEHTKKGFKSTWGDFEAEGLVCRPDCVLLRRTGDRIITKIKHEDFLR